MKRFRYSLRVLLLAVVLLASLVVPSGVASASSIYDDVYQTTSRLVVSGGSCQTTDVTYNWQSYITDSSTWTNPNDANMTTIANAFTQALSSGSVSVSQFAYNGSIDDRYIIVAFSPDSQMSLLWAQAGVSVQLPNTATLYRVGIACGDNSPRAGYSYTNGLPAGQFPTNGGIAVAQAGDGAGVLYNTTNFLYTGNFNYPTGYMGQAIQTTPPLPTIALLGDSFISGHGNGPYEAGTNEGGVNECKRSPQSFGRLVQNDLDLGPALFVACSDATTANVLYGGSGKGSWDALPQTETLSESIRHVVISVGGNDAGFSSYVLGCLVACGPGTIIYDAMRDGLEAPAFKENLKTVYGEILNHAPVAHVFVVDYPYMSAGDATTCGPFDFSGARDIQQVLNDTIRNAVLEMNDYRLHYVPTNDPGSPFEGHHLCTTESGGAYFGITTLHPNAAGHQAYAQVLEEAMFPYL